MTVAQGRVPAGASDDLGRPAGGRFASAVCPQVYALLDELAPEPEDGEVVAVGGSRVVLHRRRCPHGHYVSWASAKHPKTGRPNCAPCARGGF